jgi:hypothetical protein
MLDMFQQAFDQEAAPQANEGHDLPATFGESFADAWQAGQLATSAIRQQNARNQAVSEYTDQIKAAGGDVDGEYARQLAMGGSVATSDGSTSGGPDPLEVANGVVARLKSSADAAGRTLPFTPMSSDDIDTRAAQISQQAIATNAAMQARPQTVSSWLGKTAGALASAATDPYNIPLMALPVEGLGVLGTAAAFGLGSAATQAVNEGVNAGFNEKVQPGYAASGQAISNIAEAGVSGALMGGGIKALGNVLTRAVTGTWPTAAKDAANGVMSEADILNSNVLPGADGEAAHNGALGKAIGDVLKGDPVDVSRDIPAGGDFERRIGDIPTEAPPPQEPDTVRFYHASKEGAEVGNYSAWITPSEDYARNFRSGDVPNEVSYVDIPKDHPEISGETAPGYDAINNIYQHFHASEDLSKGLQPLPTPEAAAAMSEAVAEAVRPGSMSPEELRSSLAAPEAMNAARADVERAIDQAAQKGEAPQVPLGFDFERDGDGHPIMSGMFGNQTTMTPIFGNVADALAEVDKMNELAAQIMACATPGAMQTAAE